MGRGLQRCCFGPAERTVFCCAWARILLGFCRFATVPSEVFLQPNLLRCWTAKLLYPIHPSLSNSLLLAGSKVLNGPRSSNPWGTAWAWILLGCGTVPSEVFLQPHLLRCWTAKLLYPIHPSLSNSLLLAGSKVLKGPRSSNPLGAPWAWILLGFCRFGTVP